MNSSRHIVRKENFSEGANTQAAKARELAASPTLASSQAGVVLLVLRLHVVAVVVTAAVGHRLVQDQEGQHQQDHRDLHEAEQLISIALYDTISTGCSIFLTCTSLICIGVLSRAKKTVWFTFQGLLHCCRSLFHTFQ